MINMTALEWDGFSTSFISANAIIFLMICIMLPFLQLYLFQKNFDKIKEGDEELAEQIGAFYEGLKEGELLERNVVYYLFWYLMRRFILAVLVVGSRSIFYWQVAGTVYSSMVAIIIIGLTNPLETKHQNTMEYFNEFCILLVCYSSMVFTDWVPSTEIQFEMGYACIAAVLGHIAVNISIMGIEAIRNARLRYTRWRLRRKFAKVRGERMLRHQQKERHIKWKADTEKYINRKPINQRRAEL